MYWPVGAARIYSANPTRQKDPKDHDFQRGKESGQDDPGSVLDLRTSRSGHLIATITAVTMTIWQASPIVVLATTSRSVSSIRDYGPNVAVLLRPDASIAVVQTSNGFLVTYSLIVDPSNRVYQQIRDGDNQQKTTGAERLILEQERAGLREVNIKFRMVIRIDAGIAAALALDHEVIVATKKPAAVQCIRWTPDSAGGQTSTELVSRMAWMSTRSTIQAMMYDRAMSLAVWITSDGRAYAVQRCPEASKELDEHRSLFRGYGFHNPENSGVEATKAAINARFSLLAVGCLEGEIYVYTARDYAGSIPLSHRIHAPASFGTTGHITCLSYSPDGYCLLAGYEHGWALWSVYGKPGASSFSADTHMSKTNDERWLTSVGNFSWANAGSELLLTSINDSRLWAVEMAKSAVTGCFSSANISRTLLLTKSHLMIYRGFDLPSTANMSANASLWQHVAIPAAYLMHQRPIRSAVISHDGRYIAIAGKRGLAHYSVSSGRWKTFEVSEAENAFVVRGGICWYQHILIAAVESDGDGDPLQDVANASVLFLVDAKLVLLQSSMHEGNPKYDMRVIAHNVEYFDLMRDQGTLLDSPSQSLPESPSGEEASITGIHADRALRDSLWYFNGESVQCWTDVEDLLTCASTENDRDLPPPVSLATDFYPISIWLNRGIVLGLDPELIQRRDVHFAMFRYTIRTQLFLPHILRQCLSDLDPAAASVLALRYQGLPYFSHALELLLHMVLDDEVDANLDAENSLMPSVVSFLSAFPDFLDIVVQCTRKTEVRSWRTLFAYLPSPQRLFEEALEKGLLKTAGGYLLVLHTFQELETSSEQCIRLLQKAKEVGDWDLCKELGRFLMALDTSGVTLHEALRRMSIEIPGKANDDSSERNLLLATPRPSKGLKQYRLNGDSPGAPDCTSSETVLSPNGTADSEDYFSSRSG
ncbi:MAG: hypothetical protein Q9213_006949 [Squamulea squamosa]